MPLLYNNGQTQLHQGDSLAQMRALPAATFDAIITDPPYCSGGNGQRQSGIATSKKYTTRGNTPADLPEFLGDNRDQRGLLVWATLWLAEIARLTKPGGLVMTFTDDRQIPTFSDAYQAAGLPAPRLLVWDKTLATRPRKGGFRSQCEYILTTRLPGNQVAYTEDCLPGLFRHHRDLRPGKRFHLTDKPLPLMHDLLAVLAPATTHQAQILDPFAGGGSTLIAAQELGHKSTGIELSEPQARLTAKRLATHPFPQT